MANVSMKALLESGVHFGHRTNKWDPRMKPYIFTERNGIHILDLQQTVKLLGTALAVVRDAVSAGGAVLFVGTKRQAQETIRDEATRVGMPYVTERWLGGMLTNWSTMHARIKELDRLEGLRDSGEINRLTKKEGLLIQREIDRLLVRLSGVRKMGRLPEIVFVVDVGREDAAVHEANMLKIPVIAMVDTNCNPQGIDYVIPSNDDAIRAIKLLVAKVADAVLEGKALRKDVEAEVGADDAAESASDSSQSHRTTEVVETDENVGEGDLLGESTLAKLSAARHPEESTAAAQPPAEDATMAEPLKAAASEQPMQAIPDEGDAAIKAEPPKTPAPEESTETTPAQGDSASKAS